MRTQGPEISKETGNFQVVEAEQDHLTGKFLLGNPKTVGHRADPVTRSLLGAFSSTTLHSREASMSKLRFPSWKRSFLMSPVGGGGAGHMF